MTRRTKRKLQMPFRPVIVFLLMAGAGILLVLALRWLATG